MVLFRILDILTEKFYFNLIENEKINDYIDEREKYFVLAYADNAIITHDYCNRTKNAREAKRNFGGLDGLFFITCKNKFQAFLELKSTGNL